MISYLRELITQIRLLENTTTIAFNAFKDYLQSSPAYPALPSLHTLKQPRGLKERWQKNKEKNNMRHLFRVHSGMCVDHAHHAWSPT